MSIEQAKDDVRRELIVEQEQESLDQRHEKQMRR
jgi:hypothetical protein